jgi:hypothetical protein
MLAVPENPDAEDATVIELVSMLLSLLVLSCDRNDRSVRWMPLLFSWSQNTPVQEGLHHLIE